MKRFLAQAGKSTAGPSKKVKGTGAAAAQANAVAVPRDAANKLAHQLKQKEWTNLDSNGSAVLYWPRLLSSISKRVLSSLLQEVPWEQRNVVLFGRSVPQPRLICYMADGAHLRYTYSGLTVEPQPWSTAVQEVKQAVEHLCGCTFNSCLLNQYRTGQDSLSWHSDDETHVYGRNPMIASVSFGESRDFMIRHIGQRDHKMKINLSAGDVLVMAGAMQQHWQHCVPQRKTVLGPRVNLTFRNVLHPEIQQPGKQHRQQQPSAAAYSRQQLT